MEMTGRERLLAALSHREGDRVPLVFGGPSCSIHRAAHRRLLDHLGLSAAAEPAIMDSILQIVEPDERLYEALGIDTVFLVPAEGPVHWRDDGQEYVDELGRCFRAGGGFYNQVGAPLAEGTVEELRAYRFPDLLADDRAAGLAAKGSRWRQAGYGLAGDGAWGIYEISSSLRGTADLFVDMALRPAYVEELAERVLEEHILPFYTMLLGAAGPLLDVVGVSDDLGDQESLLFSPRFYRQVYKPRLRWLVEHIKRLADVKVYMHSDGAVSDLIPDFIEAGVDGLNPVQYTARGMQAERLKREFGKDLGFFGGGVENELLSYGSTAEIERQVRSQVAALKPGGGYLFATIHNISPEVPPENVAALFAAGRESGRYA